jgi:hypothetical protein
MQLQYLCATFAGDPKKGFLLKNPVRLDLHRLRKIARNAPSLFMGYNLYVDTDKLRLIDHVFQSARPSARSFADLGGVWKVDCAYSRYTLKKHNVKRGIVVDTDFPQKLEEKLSRDSRLRLIHGDFASPEVASRVGQVDVIFLFDVLLHQANPSWDVVLSMYADKTSCLVIYNQQYILGNTSVRLTSLPFEEYLALTPGGRDEVYRQVYAHGDEIHPEYKKPWRDIHNIFQWGITDHDLRSSMNGLGFQEVFSRNYGKFSSLTAFENHAFIFIRGLPGGQ